VSIPRWLLFLVAAWVIAFGIFRIVIALRPRRAERGEQAGPNFMRRGLYARAPRTHVLFGALYVLLGGFLIATGFGWAPVLDIAACAGAQDQEPTVRPDSRTAIPISPAPSASRPSDSASGK
jgi:hypothetical protein